MSILVVLIMALTMVIVMKMIMEMIVSWQLIQGSRKEHGPTGVEEYLVRLGKIARGQGRQRQKYLGQPSGTNKILANYVPGPMHKRVAAKKSRRLAWVFFHGAGAGPNYSFQLPCIDQVSINYWDGGS